MTNNKECQCTLVVSSCDNYSDLWLPFFNLLKIHWPDCPYKILLITEEKYFNYKGVISTQIGPGLDWSTLLGRSLDMVKTPYVLFMLEDFFLRSVVDSELLQKNLENMNRSSIEMLRLIPSKKIPIWSGSHSNYSNISLKERYRVSTQGAFWKLEVLQDLVNPGESAWEFEINGTKRSSLNQSGKFFSVNKALLPYGHHVVERGKWFPWEARRFKKMNIGCNFSKRRVMSWWDSLLWYARKNASKLKYILVN